MIFLEIFQRSNQLYLTEPEGFRLDKFECQGADLMDTEREAFFLKSACSQKKAKIFHGLQNLK